MRKSFLADKYRPTGEGILKESKISVACGAIGILIYGLLVLISYKEAGNSGALIGLLGWALIFDAASGIFYAVSAFRQPGGKIVVKTLGMALNIILLLILFSMFVKGIA